MNDDLAGLRQALRTTEAPDLWAEIERRAEGPGPDVVLDLEAQRRNRRLVAVAAVLLVAAALTGAIAIGSRRGDDGQVRTGGGGVERPERRRPEQRRPEERPVSCGEIPYPREALRGPVGAEQDPDAAAAGLRDFIANEPGMLTTPSVSVVEGGTSPEVSPPSGWRRLYDRDGVAVFGLGELDGGNGMVEVELREEGGTYRFAGSTLGCQRATVDVGDRSIVRFDLLEGAEVAPTATSITVEVREAACAGDVPLEGRLGPPEIEYGPGAVGLLFTADPLPPGFYTCAGSLVGDKVTVPLDEPLGDRRIVDLGFYPPRDVAADD